MYCLNINTILSILLGTILSSSVFIILIVVLLAQLKESVDQTTK